MKRLKSLLIGDIAEKMQKGFMELQNQHIPQER